VVTSVNASAYRTLIGGPPLQYCTLSALVSYRYD